MSRVGVVCETSSHPKAVDVTDGTPTTDYLAPLGCFLLGECRPDVFGLCAARRGAEPPVTRFKPGASNR